MARMRTAAARPGTWRCTARPRRGAGRCGTGRGTCGGNGAAGAGRCCHAKPCHELAPVHVPGLPGEAASSLVPAPAHAYRNAQAGRRVHLPSSCWLTMAVRRQGDGSTGPRCVRGQRGAAQTHRFVRSVILRYTESNERLSEPPAKTELAQQASPAQDCRRSLPAQDCRRRQPAWTGKQSRERKEVAGGWRRRRPAWSPGH